MTDTAELQKVLHKEAGHEIKRLQDKVAKLEGEISEKEEMTRKVHLTYASIILSLGCGIALAIIPTAWGASLFFILALLATLILAIEWDIPYLADAVKAILSKFTPRNK